jgi:F0F1-type ATP synthase assembly protein I
MKQEKLQMKNSTALAISFAWELGYSIAIPLVALALGGRFLDRRFDTDPFLFLTGVVLSIFISTLIVFKKSMKIMASLEKESQREKPPTEERDKKPDGDKQ